MNLILFYFIMLYFGEEQKLLKFCTSHVLCNQSFTSLHVGTCGHAPPPYQLHECPIGRRYQTTLRTVLNGSHAVDTTKITFCCILHHNRNLKHVVPASLWQHKFAARHVVSVVQSGAPQTWHSCQLYWKPIDLFRTLKMPTHSNVTSEP
jgi:hypothetical protein